MMFLDFLYLFIGGKKADFKRSHIPNEQAELNTIRSTNSLDCAIGARSTRCVRIRITITIRLVIAGGVTMRQDIWIESIAH